MKRTKAPELPEQEPYNPLGSRAVAGLDHGRDVARKQQRRRRRRDRITSTITFLLVLGVVGAAAWFGYAFYQEQSTDDLLEDEFERIDEADRTGNDLDDAINQLETEGRWNGPGNPVFGVEEDDADAGGDEVTVVTAP